MAISASRGTITATRGTLVTYPDTPGLSHGQRPPGWDVRLRVASGGTAVLGGPGVLAGSGYALTSTSGVLELNLDPGETLCAIRPTAGTTVVHVLTSTRD